MKLFKSTLLVLIFFISLISYAQADKDPAFLVHVDEVRPGDSQAYEKTSMALNDACKKHDLKEASWRIVRSNTGHYTSISPIDNMADLDRNIMAPLQEKMGKEAFGNLFKEFDSYYDRHYSYVLHLSNKHTYMPNGFTMDTEGENYRKMHRFKISPKHVKKLSDKFKEIKTLFESKGSKLHYRVYYSGFGCMDTFALVAISAKDEADYAQKIKTNNELLGDEWPKLWNSFLGVVSEYTVESGQMLPELAYTPK